MKNFEGDIIEELLKDLRRQELNNCFKCLKKCPFFLYEELLDQFTGWVRKVLNKAKEVRK